MKKEQIKAEILELGELLFGVKPKDVSDEGDFTEDGICFYHEGFYIFQTDKKVVIETIAGHREVDRFYWEIGCETYDSGSYWEPPSGDYFCINGKIDGHVEGMRQLALKLQECQINNQIQSWGESKSFSEMEELDFYA